MTPGTPPPGPGSRFGHYRIDGVIGVGGMGMVYAATDLRLGRQVALKIVLGHYAESEEFIQRFQREAAALARLDSPHVINIFDHGVEGTTPFIATQYAAGGDLGKLLRERGAMPPALAAQLCAQVADALVAAHRVGVVHRDVKPANVLLRDGRLDRLHVYLCDFGVALTEAGGLTTPGSVAGTWNYLAPERSAGQPGSPASDIYSVGCLLWEALTGTPPYAGSDVEVAMAHLSSPVPQLPGGDAFTAHANRILAGTMAKDPAQRYQSAAVLRDDLRSLAGILSGARATVPEATPVPGGRPVRRRGLVWVAAGVAVAAVVAGAVVAVAVTAGDDEPGAGGSPSPRSPGSTETPGGTDSPDATEPPEETEPPSTPDTSGPIAGDLDGNGFGDVGILTFDGLQVYASDGSALADVKVQRNVGFVAVTGDVEGDGKLDLLKVQGDPPRMAVSVAVPGAPTSPVVTPKTDLASSSLDVDVSLADVDGDGDGDVVLGSRLKEREIQLDVALGDGSGVFARPTTWYSGPLNEGDLVVGDVDDDGLADLVHYDPGVRTNTDPLGTLLRSTGSAFEIAGDPLVVDVGGFALAGLRIADVDGDGNEEVVAVTGYGPKINVWEWNGSGFDQTPWYDNSDTLEPGPSIESLLVSDLDGNGFDDVVTLTFDRDFKPGLTVYLSDGTAFAPGEQWDRPIGDVTSKNPLDNEDYL